MEITIKISLSPEEAKESTGALIRMGPAPSIEPAISLEGSPTGEVLGLQGSLPSPDLSPIEFSQTLEAPMPVLMAEVFPEQVPPEIPMMEKESPPIPIAVLEERGLPVPDLSPDTSSTKRSKEDKL